ncbi:TIGR03943 family putative permease subunit [Streptomyces sp. NPDC001480]|uniref:TIGR03943 family putative permease subunit n=1 Tax=Streptomyces sp. NPDC001480 TaxID=3364577 RepID=UPI0036CD87B7
MNRQAQAAVLFLTGAALLHAGLTDLYLRYVKAGLQPLLLTAGALLVVTALATAWYEWKRARRKPPAAGSMPATDGHDDAEDHGHAHPEPRISWLLILPLLALILVAPPALGSYSAMRTGTALQQPYGYTSLPAANPVPIGLVDYAGRAVYDHGRSLGGRQVRITGFVALDRAGTPYLVRMALNCCAADAQPVKIGLMGKIPPVLQPDSWLEVTGTYTPKQVKDPVNNGPIPFLKVTAARPVPTPHDPYDESWNT